MQILVAGESLPSGRSSRECKELDITQVIKQLYHFAGSGAYECLSESHAPLGLVAISAAYDSALLSIVGKLAPALAAGNTCLIVPNRLTPLSAFLFAEICEQSGVPLGVVNVVYDSSDSNDGLLSWIAGDARIAALTFDGRLSRAQELVKQASVSPSKRVLVSTEGKSSLVVYESADIDSAIEAVVEGCFYSNGQV